MARTPIDSSNTFLRNRRFNDASGEVGIGICLYAYTGILLVAPKIPAYAGRI